jgi:hypothetical protein
MFPPPFASSPERRPIPFTLDGSERQLLDDLATRISEAHLKSGWMSEEECQSVHVIADPTADPDLPICLCSGTGERLAEILARGFRLTPLAERAAVAQAADALAARLVVAMAPSAEEAANPDDRVLENIYRTGLGLPVRWHRLGEDQVEIMIREAQAFASLTNLVIRAGNTKTEVGNRAGKLSPAGDPDDHHIADLIVSAIQSGQTPELSFVDRATGGRPGVVATIELVNPETFFASFTVTFDINNKWVSRWNIADGTSLRQTLIELGRNWMDSRSTREAAPLPA